MLAALLSAWTFVRANWKAALVGLAAIGVMLVRAMLIRQGRDQERTDQAERNQRARREASDARTDALTADDPRDELRRDFSRPDSGR